MEFQKHHILVVEDEESLSKALALNLQIENYSVTIAKSGSQALKHFNNDNLSLSLVLLDVMLPEINGFDLCREFKKINPKVPIIFLTAKSQFDEKIAGLKLGADDYIVKPFELEELLLRVNNVVRRHQPPKSPHLFYFGLCSVNFETFEILDITGKTSTLSKREIGLLKLLTERPNKVISRNNIIDKLWAKNENPSSRTIDNYILLFRKYFEVNSKEPKHFHSIRGVGYKFTS